METKKILQKLNRKAIFSVLYLFVAAALVIPLYYFTDFNYLDHAGKSVYPVQMFTDMLESIDLWLLVIATVIFYFVHFFYGAIYYRAIYRQDIKMDMEYTDPETRKSFGDSSISRGLLICAIWSAIFCFAGKDVYSVQTQILIVLSWFLLHIALIVLTSTFNLVSLATKTVDLTIVMPEEYPAREGKKNPTMTLYFYIPTSVGESAWCEKYIKEYVRYKKRMLSLEMESNQKVIDFSERIARG